MEGLPSAIVGIGPSLLGEEAGDGLFVYQNINIHQWVADYGGEILTREQANESTSTYIFQHPVNKKLYIDGQDPTSGHGRWANDPLDEEMENMYIAVKPDPQPEDPTQPKALEKMGYKAKRVIKKGNEGYVAYCGEFWASSRYPLHIRQKAAKRYPDHKAYILNAAGEGECDHDTCIEERIKHIQLILNNTKTPPAPNLACRLDPPQPGTPTTDDLGTSQNTEEQNTKQQKTKSEKKTQHKVKGQTAPDQHKQQKTESEKKPQQKVKGQTAPDPKQRNIKDMFSNAKATSSNNNKPPAGIG